MTSMTSFCFCNKKKDLDNHYKHQQKNKRNTCYKYKKAENIYQKTLWFSDIFTGQRKGALETNGLRKIIAEHFTS